MSKESKMFCKTSAGFPERCAGNLVPLRSDVQNILRKDVSYFSLLVLLSWCYRRCCHSGETPLSHETWFSQTTLRCKALNNPRTYLCVHRAFPFKLLELLRKPNASILSGKTTKWKMCRVLIYLFQGRVPNGIVVVQGTLNTTNARRKTKQSNWSRP